MTARPPEAHRAPARRRRILLASTLYHPKAMGGAERVVQTLAEGLVRQGQEVSVLTTRPAGTLEREDIHGVQVHRLRVKNLYQPFAEGQGPLAKLAWHKRDDRNAAMGASIGRILDEVAPEVVNTHTIAGLSSTVWTESARRGIPVVHTLHDQYLLCIRGTMFRREANCRSQCLDCRLSTTRRRAATSAVDAVVAVSAFILERHRRHGLFASTPAHIIRNAIPPVAPAPPPTGGAIRFGFQGRLHPTKGVQNLLMAFKRLPIGAAELWIAGQGPADFEAHLRRIADGRPDIRFLGFAPAGHLQQNVDYWVVPSLWHETAALTIMEGVEAGLPVLASDRGGNAELIPPDAGELFDPDDIEGLAAMLQAKAALPARRLPPPGLYVDAEGQVASYLRAFEAAIGGRP